MMGLNGLRKSIEFGVRKKVSEMCCLKDKKIEVEEKRKFERVGYRFFYKGVERVEGGRVVSLYEHSWFGSNRFRWAEGWNRSRRMGKDDEVAWGGMGKIMTGFHCCVTREGAEMMVRRKRGMGKRGERSFKVMRVIGKVEDMIGAGVDEYVKDCRTIVFGKVKVSSTEMVKLRSRNNSLKGEMR